MKPYFLLILTVILFSGNIVVGRAINELPPVTITFFRCLIAFLILLPLGYNSIRRNTKLYKTEWKTLTALGLTGAAFFNLLIYSALQFTSSTNVAIVETAIPAFTILLGILILKEKLASIQWAGVALSLFGAIWVITEGSLSVMGNLQFNQGDIIALGAVFVWSAYSILVKQHMWKFSAYGVVTAMTGIATVALFPLLVIEWFFTGFPPLFNMNLAGGLLYLGIFPSVIALISWNKGVSELGPSKASVFLNFLPVFTMAMAAVFLNETISMHQILGAVLVISGVYLSTRKGKKPASGEK
ncbi:DMT family transporter [Evansella sp. LMS18]|uniref:DMT family transporter n=1 Tax=Evansella sp. LMS18 TaxID=2924033 RepID=UPI0020D1692B|nr:DMT family transporter [Evansella sp. LMS18]UTR08811.1 DMT family transporter [Evansella sp. LMS18]